MQEKGMLQSTEQRASILLRKVCSGIQIRKYTYPIRSSDSKIYYQGAWRSLSQVLKRREQQRERNRNKSGVRSEATKKRERERARLRYRLDPEYRERTNKARVERKRRDGEVSRKKWRDWYQRNKVAYCAAERKRRDKRDPTRIIQRADRAFRKGEISAQEFGRLVDSAIERATGLITGGSEGDKGSLPNLSGVQDRGGDSRNVEIET